jgi:Zn-dependent protease
MTTAVPTAFPCERCGMVLFHGNLVCPGCGALVYARMLNDVAARAHQEEQAGNVLRAAMTWREALPLLPPTSQQYQFVTQRIGALTARFSHGVLANFPTATPAASAAGLHPAGEPAAETAGLAAARPAPRNDPWQLALAKTLGSMLISIAVYTIVPIVGGGVTVRLQFAVGFVLLMLVHELGHSLAMRYFRLSASPPIFIPFLGAVITLRQMPRNAWEEAVVGIGGPVTGTLAAGVTYLIYLQTGSELFLKLSLFGFLLNLFNMLPVPPLDGGRVTAAVSPWVWITGLLGVVAWFANDFFRRGMINPILILLLVMAWPRVFTVLSQPQRRRTPYYQIGRRAKWAMGVAYAVLGVALYVMFALCNFEVTRRFGSGWFG